MAAIAELSFDLSYTDQKMAARLFAPIPEGRNWTCRFEIEDPIGVSREIYGASSMQALCLSLKTLAAYLYGSDLYKNGELGIYGEFGGSLSLPAPQEFLKDAPYPF